MQRQPQPAAYMYAFTVLLVSPIIAVRCNVEINIIAAAGQPRAFI
jgi:hypothetical protein